MMMGTPSYMAPEQVVGGKITPATDIFAMGSVLYELLTGARPFEGNTLHNTLYKIVSEDPPPIRDVMPGLPAALDRIVRKALEKEPDNRYKSALEMADDLAAVRAELDSEKKTTSTLSLRRSMQTAIEKQTEERAKRRTYLAVAGLVLLIVGAGATALWLGGGEENQAADPIALATPESASGSALPSTPSSDTATTAGNDTGTQAATTDSQPAPTVQEERSPRPTTERRAEVPTRTTPAPTPNVVRNQPVDTPSVRQATPIDTPAVVVSRQPPTDTVVLRPIVEPQRGNPDTPRTVVTETPPVQRNPEPPPVSDSTLISRVLQSYARAIESRDVEAVRRAYPGLTASQQRGWQQFFDATRSLAVNLRINRLQISGAAADATVSGTYDYATSRGQQSEPVSFQALLRKENGIWRIVEVR
jgi:serine/threonine-protein kinase